MKQGVLNHNSNTANNAANLKQNANTLIAKGPNKASFANEMNKLQNANALIANDNPADAANQNAAQQELLTPDAEVAKFKDVLKQALANKGLDFDSLSPEMKEKLAMMQDAVRQESVRRQGQEESVKHAEDLDNKFSALNFENF